MSRKHAKYRTVERAYCIYGYHAAVSELLACGRELRNVYGYCDSKDRLTLGKLSRVCRKFNQIYSNLMPYITP